MVDDRDELAGIDCEIDLCSARTGGVPGYTLVTPSRRITSVLDRGRLPIAWWAS